MHAKIKVRGNKLWIHGTYEGEFRRYPTGLDDTPEHNKWLARNIVSEFLRIHNERSSQKTKASDGVSLEAFAKKSLAMHTRKENTIIEYEQIFKNDILPSFLNTNISDIKVSDLVVWQNTLLKKNSPKTVSNKRVVFSKILSDALNDGVIKSNPFDKVERPKKIHKELNLDNLDADDDDIHNIDPFSINEIKTLLGASSGWFKNFIQVAFFSGMRTGEIIGLRWSDINFVEKKIKVRRSIRKKKITAPKTDDSIRTIDMLPLCEEAIIAQKMHTFMKNGFVFLDENANHFSGADKLREVYWYKLLKAAKVNKRILYQTRHTFASQMLANGEDLVWVSHMLGHADIQVTSQRYVKFIKSEQKARATFLDTLFNNQENYDCTIVAHSDLSKKAL